MKKLFYLLAASIITMQGCDKIEMPYRQVGAPTGGGGSGLACPDSTVVEETGVITKVRKVLLEDYTGHTCGNCPKAAVKLHEIQVANPEKVVGIAIHAGSFAQVSSPKYTTDFQSTEGTAWDVFFGISNAGNPNGMINRIDKPAGQHIKYHDTWAASVSAALAIAPDAHIHIRNTYFTDCRILKTHISNEYLTAQNGTYKLSVVIVENGIVDYQKDYSVFPDAVPNYVFDHVLRGSMNGTWGDEIATGAIAVGATQTKDYELTLPTTWNVANCKVVAFVYNATTYEVMQAEELKIIP